MGEEEWFGEGNGESNYKDCWESLREYLLVYQEEHSVKGDSESVYGRYCIAISVEDLLEKMDEIEGNGQK